MFWNFKNVEGNDQEAELRISGEIVSNDAVWMYEWFGMETISPNEFRDELSKYKGKNITVWIDSYGGDVFAAAGIYNLLKQHDGIVHVKIDGKAISAASVIAMAGTTVEMSPVAIMMIHNPLSVAQGDSREMIKMAGILDEVKQTIINAYELKTGRSRSKLSQMMDDETWMGAKTAQKEGFIDGMLFADTGIQNSFEFNRMQINNTITESMRGFFETHSELLKNTNGEATQPVVDTKKLEKQKKEFERIKNKIGGI